MLGVMQKLPMWVAIMLVPEWIDAIVQQGHQVEVMTLFSPTAQPSLAVPEGQVAYLSFDINVLKYSYGIPLFTALMLATPGKDETQWTQWIIGLVILYLAQTFGVCLEMLKILAFSLGPEVSAQLDLSGLQQEMIALGYQLGYLILPAVTPLALWIGFSQQFLVTLVPGLEFGQHKADKD